MKIRLIFKKRLKNHDQKSNPNQSQEVFLGSISKLLYNIELLHDFVILVQSPNYAGYQFSRYFWIGGRIQPIDKIIVKTISKNSPFEVVLILSSSASALIAQLIPVFANAFAKLEKVKNAKRQLEFELEKKKIENEKKKIELKLKETKLKMTQLELLKSVENFRKEMELRDDRDTVTGIYDSLIKRLDKSELSLVCIEQLSK